jgi:hypothetical protein
VDTLASLPPPRLPDVGQCDSVSALPEVELLPQRVPSERISALAEQERKRSEQMRVDLETSLRRLAEQEAMRESKSVLDGEWRAQQEQERDAFSRARSAVGNFWLELQAQDQEARARREAARKEKMRIIQEEDARERHDMKTQSCVAAQDRGQELAQGRARLEQALTEISNAIRAEENELQHYGEKQMRHLEQGQDRLRKEQAIADEKEEMMMNHGEVEEEAPLFIPIQEQLAKLVEKQQRLREEELYPAAVLGDVNTSDNEALFHPSPRQVPSP